VRENESILARALGAHPGLNDVVAHVEEDVAVFEQAWSAEANAFPESARTVAAVRRDRGALPRGRASAARWGWRVTAAAAVVAFAFVVNFLIQRESGLESVTTGPDQTHE